MPEYFLFSCCFSILQCGNARCMIYIKSFLRLIIYCGIYSPVFFDFFFWTAILFILAWRKSACLPLYSLPGFYILYKYLVNEHPGDLVWVYQLFVQKNDDFFDASANLIRNFIIPWCGSGQYCWNLSRLLPGNRFMESVSQKKNRALSRIHILVGCM